MNDDTGTDRVELTICIPGQCCQGYCVDDTLHDLTKDQADRVRDVVAARVQALTAEDRTEPLQDALNATVAQRDAARAEVAAANARCAELEEQVRYWMNYGKGQTECGRELLAERDALQATLDRISALADEWEAEAAKATRPVRKMGAGSRADKFIQGNATNLARQAKRLRAALTPEGTE